MGMLWKNSVQDFRLTCHMSGKNINLPEGFVVYQVFYLLHGGTKAQDKFFELWTSALTDKFNVQFSTSNLDTPFLMTYHSNDYAKLENK